MRLPESGVAATLSRMLRRLLTTLLIASAYMLMSGLLSGCAHHKPHRRSDDATLTQADLPANVEKSFKRDHDGSTIKQIDKQTDGVVVRYKITYFDPDQTRHQVMYDREGDTLDAVTPADDSGGK